MPLRLIAPVALLVLVLSAPFCSPRKKLVGTWESVSITNPSKMLSRGIGDGGRGTVRASFVPEGRYLWDDNGEPEKKVGTFVLEGGRLVLRDSKSGEMVRMKCRFKGDTLVLETEDRFTFTFRRVKAL